MKNLMNQNRVTHRYITLLVVLDGTFLLFHFPCFYLPDTVRWLGRGADPHLVPRS